MPRRGILLAMSRALLCVAVLGSLLSAQTVVPSIAAATPLPCNLVVGAQTTNQTVPVGPLPNVGGVAAVGGAGLAPEFARVNWVAGAGSTDATFRLSLSTQVQNGSVAHAGPGEIVVTFAGAGTAALPARFELSVNLVGIQPVQLAVDTGNNGTWDWQYGMTPLVGTTPDLVAQPLQFRVGYDLTAVLPGSAQVDLELRLVPDAITVVPMAVDCGIANTYAVGALWDTRFADLELRAGWSAWHVVGISSQPQLLLSSLTLTAAPCLVVPSLDLVLRTGTLNLPMPAAVRPITLYAQLLDVLPHVRVSDAYLIHLR